MSAKKKKQMEDSRENARLVSEIALLRTESKKKEEARQIQVKLVVSLKSKIVSLENERDSLKKQMEESDNAYEVRQHGTDSRDALVTIVKSKLAADGTVQGINNLNGLVLYCETHRPESTLTLGFSPGRLRDAQAVYQAVTKGGDKLAHSNRPNDASREHCQKVLLESFGSITYGKKEEREKLLAIVSSQQCVELTKKRKFERKERHDTARKQSENPTLLDKNKSILANRSYSIEPFKKRFKSPDGKKNGSMPASKQRKGASAGKPPLSTPIKCSIFTASASSGKESKSTPATPPTKAASANKPPLPPSCDKHAMSIASASAGKESKKYPTTAPSKKKKH